MTGVNVSRSRRLGDPHYDRLPVEAGIHPIFAFASMRFAGRSFQRAEAFASETSKDPCFTSIRAARGPYLERARTVAPLFFERSLLDSRSSKIETTRMDPSAKDVLCEQPRQFLTTSWTLISRASGVDASAREALTALCTWYWQPLLRFHQQFRSGHSNSADGEDLVQSFFVWLIESEFIKRADEGRGRFRTFLLAAFKQFLSRHHQYQSAAKRSPANPLVSIHSIEFDNGTTLEPFHQMTADKVFDYHWAVELVERAMHRLETEWSNEGRSERFQVLRGYLCGNKELRGREIAEKLGMTEGAVRVAIHRLRQRYAELLRQEVRYTTHSDAEAESELQELFEILRGH